MKQVSEALVAMVDVGYDKNQRQSMSEPMVVPWVEKVASVAQVNGKSVEPHWFRKRLDGVFSCEENGAVSKKCKRVNLVVTKNAREKWRDMVMGQVSDVTRGGGGQVPLQLTLPSSMGHDFPSLEWTGCNADS